MKEYRPVPPLTAQFVYQRDGYRCQIPDGKGRICGSPFDLTIDHIIPRNQGGSDEAVNLRVACRNCNQRKGHTTDLGRSRDPRRDIERIWLHRIPLLGKDLPRLSDRTFNYLWEAVNAEKLHRFKETLRFLEAKRQSQQETAQ